MADAPKLPRRPRGSLREPTSLGWNVELDNKEKWQKIAAHAGVSAAALFDMMVETLELDPRGYPSWFVAPPLDDGELPIDAA